MNEALETEPETEMQSVEIVRGVRFGRLMIVGAVIGAAIAVILTILNPVQPDGFYTLAQVAGLMLVIGAALGLLGGGLLALLLNLFVRGKKGTGTAKHTNVR